MSSLANDLSIGLLLVLERLGPEERAAYILREAFDTSYAEIAATLGKNEPAVRQLVSRARDHMRASRPRFKAKPEEHQHLLAQFLTAVASNDAQQLLSIFQPNIQLVSDGGGKRPAALRVLHTPQEVAQLVLHLSSVKGGPTGIKPVTLNGVPSIWFQDGQGYESAMQLDVVDGKISSIFIVRNPDKLGHLNLH